MIGMVGEIERLFYKYVNRIYGTANNEGALMIRYPRITHRTGSSASYTRRNRINALIVLERPGGSSLRQIERGLVVSVDDLLDDAGAA